MRLHTMNYSNPRMHHARRSSHSGKMRCRVPNLQNRNTGFDLAKTRLNRRYFNDSVYFESFTTLIKN